MRKIRRVIVPTLLVLALPVMLQAHSTAGLEKVTLRAWTVEVDNVAFFLEQDMGKRLDDQGRRYRYSIWDFDALEQHGSRVEVFTQVYDQKTTTKTPESFYLKRNPDFSWNLVDKDGQVLQERIYTYVDPKARQARLKLAAGGVVCLCLVVVMAVMRRRSLYVRPQNRT